MLYKNDQRIVMTLDAGGTNLVFSAIRGCEEITEPVLIPSTPNCLDSTLNNLVEGFSAILKALPEAPAAISFAFPGPADYPAGIIGDLPNFPSFRGGVAIGPFLKEKFGIPVFINNDGDLFAYGEALMGVLPEINSRLEKTGSIKRYKNLVGVTLGTGFGAGIVLNGQLLRGDNASGGDIYCIRNKKYPECIIEEGVSIRAIKRVYGERSGIDASSLTPKDIFDIAEGTKEGDKDAALAAFAELGEMAGDGLCAVSTFVDGIIVIGGGLAGASKYFMPSLISEMNSSLGMMDGYVFPRLQMRTFDLDDENSFAEFAIGKATKVLTPGTDQLIDYDPMKRIGVIISKQGASRSIALGAYIFALNNL